MADKKIPVISINVPKRPMSAYFLFAKAKREALQKKYPKYNVPQIGRELGKLWKSMNEKQQAPFKKAAVTERETYQKAIEKRKSEDPAFTLPKRRKIAHRKKPVVVEETEETEKEEEEKTEAVEEEEKAEVW